MLGQILGGLIGAGASLFGAKSEQKMQKKFAKNAVQWKVQDANKAGIHPLFALGANTTSYQPVGVGSGLADTFANMGAGIDRAQSATAEAPARGVIARLALERAGLENDLLRAQIVSEARRSLPPYVGPPMPTPGSDIQLPLGNRGIFPFKPGPSSTSQRIQDEYGDFAENVYGTGRAVVDMSDNVISRTGLKQFLNWYMSRNPGRPGGFPGRGGRR
ncbi:MAG: DNA pilot protein [Microvirus sp.]|nr:MAG: DNA pilot protein [Microvirus sp.]